MVALVPQRCEALSTALGAAADSVQFVDMTELGGNPARIIAQWQQFLTDRAGSGPVRGIGEPAWPGRSSVEYAEAALHEGLLNVAFDNGRAWRLMCPYNLTNLPWGKRPAFLPGASTTACPNHGASGHRKSPRFQP